jgi:hypothetical protein
MREGDAMDAMAGAMMTKPKSAAKRGRLVAEEKTFKTLGNRVSALYLKWNGEVAKVNRSSISGLINQVVAKYARDLGVTDAPPDRTA